MDNHFTYKLTIAALVSQLFLLGCSTTGSGSVGSGASNGSGSVGGTTPTTPTAPTATSTTPLNVIVQPTAATVDAAGNLVAAVGKVVTDTTASVLPTVTNTNLKQVFVKTGSGIGGLATGLKNGLGGASPDALNSTLSGVPVLVSETGQAVSSLGKAVSGLATEKTAILAPVVGQNGVGGLVDKAGVFVTGLGVKLDQTIQVDQTQQLTKGLSTQVLAPLTNTLTGSASKVGLTQTVGALTKTGVPVDSLLTKVGNTVSGLGLNVAGSKAPLAPEVGDAVNSAGQVVASLGGVVNDRKSDNDDQLDSGNANQLLAPLTNAIAGIQGSQSPANSALIPVTSTLAGLSGTGAGGGGGNVLVPVTSLVNGSSGAGILAPVTGIVAPATGALAPITGGVLAPVIGALTPVTGVLKPVTGGVLAPITGLLGIK